MNTNHGKSTFVFKHKKHKNTSLSKPIKIDAVVNTNEHKLNTNEHTLHTNKHKPNP